MGCMPPPPEIKWFDHLMGGGGGILNMIGQVVAISGMRSSDGGKFRVGMRSYRGVLKGVFLENSLIVQAGKMKNKN